MNKIKVVFCGTPKISAEVLKTLVNMQNVDICLVISQPDKPVGRKREIVMTPVKKFAILNNLEVVQPNKINECYEIILQKKPDFLVTCAYGQFIPENILNIPLVDAINIHASLLPKYRGGAPIQYALKNGDTETGVSIMQMVKKMDAGDFYIQEKIQIDDEDDAGTLFEKITKLAQRMISQNLLKIYQGHLKLTKQNEKLVTFSKNISSIEERIDWSSSAITIHNLIRSLSPYPIAHTFLNNQRYKIGKTLITKCASQYPPGTIVEINTKGIVVATKDFDLVILQIQRPGKKMGAASVYYANPTIDIKVGYRFE